MQVGNCHVQLVSSVKNLGVTLDCHLNMSLHIQNVCRVAYIQLRQISSIRHLLTVEATKTLICALVLSRLDYCNSLLSGCPKHLLQKLQRVQNAAARLVYRVKKSDSVEPLLRSLHWLPITSRIQYKLSVTCFNSITGTGPQYLTDLLQQYCPSRQLCFSSDTQILKVPRVVTKSFGERSFSYTGPTIWNSLPVNLRHTQSSVSFRSALKTHLFKS